MFNIFKRKENKSTMYSSRDISVLLSNYCDDPKDVHAITIRHKTKYDNIVDFDRGKKELYINVPTKNLTINGTITDIFKKFVNLREFNKEGIDSIYMTGMVQSDDTELKYNSEMAVEEKIANVKSENDFTMKLSFDGTGMYLKMQRINNPAIMQKVLIHTPSNVILDKIEQKNISYFVSNLKNFCILKIRDTTTGKEILDLTIIKTSPLDIVKIVNTHSQVECTKYLVDNSFCLTEIID